MSDWLDILSGGVDLFNAGYNVWKNNRDFNYQKNLQNQIFDREDNAVQRRVEDLKNAGLNPALANGQAAGSGSVVGRSNTDNIGASLDNVMALQQIRQQKQETENAKVQNEIIKNNATISYFDKQLALANVMYQLGIPYQTNVFKNGDGFNFKVRLNENDYGKYTQDNSPLFKSYNSQLNQLLTSEDLLNRDAQWYTADKISGLAFGLLNSLPLNFNLSNIKRR